MYTIFKSGLVVLSLSLIIGCEAPVQNLETPLQNLETIIDAAVNDPARAQANSVRDSLRMPGDVIKFMGVKPGDTVLDMVSNGGYYAEILAGVVGDGGRVIAHMFSNSGMDPNNAYAEYIRNKDHMSNVIPIYADFKNLVVEENTLDAVFLIQNFHDFYFDRFDVDVEKILAMYSSAIKSGGIMAIIDHDAGEGAPSSSGTTVHRIDPMIVKRDMEKAGFEFVGALDILKNDVDDPSKSVFDESVRGKTSRFILKFRNP